MGMVVPSQCEIKWYRSGFEWRKNRYHAKTSAVLLDAPALYFCSSRTLSKTVAMLIHSRLEIQRAQPSGVFFHLQVSYRETQHSISFRNTSNCCQVCRCCPSWLAILGKGVRTGFGSSIAGYKYTHQAYATSTLQNNTLSPALPCALPCLKPSISYLTVALLGIFVKE